MLWCLYRYIVSALLCVLHPSLMVLFVGIWQLETFELSSCMICLKKLSLLKKSKTKSTNKLDCFYIFYHGAVVK